VAKLQRRQRRSAYSLGDKQRAVIDAPLAFKF
jgi:hypothetical protein